MTTRQVRSSRLEQFTKIQSVKLLISWEIGCKLILPVELVIHKSAVQIGPIYQYKFYDRTLDEMWQKQLTVGNLTDKQYQTYVRSDALMVNDEANPTSGVVVSEGWAVRGGPSDTYWKVGTLNPHKKASTLLIRCIMIRMDIGGMKSNKTENGKPQDPEDVKYF